MSLNHLPDDALATAQDRGWNEESVVIHLKGFISDHDHDDELYQYAKDAADEETVDTSDADDFNDVVDEAGWDEDSQIIHLVGFIQGKDLTEDLIEYFETIADEERENADSDDDYDGDI